VVRDRSRTLPPIVARVIFKSRLAALAVVGFALSLTASGTAPASASQNMVPVRSADGLVAALAAAKPGETIQLAAGHYEGTFVATAKGTSEAPITLTGTAQSVLSNGAGYGLRLDGAAHWKLTGFSVNNARKGIVLDRSQHVVIDDVEVSQIAEEGVHFRTSSSDNVIRNSTVRDTGLEKPEYGEAVYIGSAVSNWGQFGENGAADRSDRNEVRDNSLGPGVAAELVDIKEGTEGGVVSGNTFDGHGISGRGSADSWVDVKGNGYRIDGNVGTFDGAGGLLDGYQTHTIVDGYGCGNSFRRNDSDLGGATGYAIKVTNRKDCSSTPNVVYADNTVTGSGSGLTNVGITS
jgi:nitrous oxidase accessory protein NosD